MAGRLGGSGMTMMAGFAGLQGGSDNSPDDAVGSLAQFLGDRVSLVDDEVLVEDLENLSSLQVGHGGRGWRVGGSSGRGSFW